MAHDPSSRARSRLGYKVSTRRARQRGAAVRQGVRQSRPVQPHLLHRRQPGQAPDRPARRQGMPTEDDRRELRLPHRRRLRPLPLRHLRHRVPQGAARRRLRRLPRHAVPAAGRPQAGHRRGARPGAEPGVLHRPSLQGDPARRRAQRPWATACGPTRWSRAPPTAPSTRAKRGSVARPREATAHASLAALWSAAAARRRSPSTARASKPKVAIIGEFWAMTTEGDGNYRLQRFLESEGAEVDIQLVTAWLLYMIWQGRWDTRERARLRGDDDERQAQGGSLTQGGSTSQAAGQPVASPRRALRGLFQLFAAPSACAATPCPTWTSWPRSPRPLRQPPARRRRPHGGGQADPQRRPRQGRHDPVRQAVRLHAVQRVSDGVQSLVTERYPRRSSCRSRRPATAPSTPTAGCRWTSSRRVGRPSGRRSGSWRKPG